MPNNHSDSNKQRSPRDYRVMNVVIESVCASVLGSQQRHSPIGILIVGCLFYSVALANDLSAQQAPGGSSSQIAREESRGRPADDETISQLILQLGDDQYVQRDDAETALLAIGGPAIQQLRMATTLRGNSAPDGEIQLRATRLLILIERKERERRIRDFLAGFNNELVFTGWPEFSKITGSDRTTRRLFVDMHQSQPELLLSIKRGRRAVEETYQKISKRSLRSNGDSNATAMVGTIAAMLFVSTLEFESEGDQSVSRISVSDNDLRRIQAILTRSQMVTFVSSSGNRKQIGKLISNWLAVLRTDDATTAGIQLEVIKAYELADQVDSTLKFASTRELPLLTRVFAIEIFSNLASDRDIEKLTPLLNEVTVVGNYLPRISGPDGRDHQETNLMGDTNFDQNTQNPQLMQVQIRDLALISAIKIANQDVANFGFDSKCINGSRLVRNKSGFFSKDDRNVAFKKWAQYMTTD